MSEFNQQATNYLYTCHENLQQLFLEVIKHRDCTIACGYLTKQEQDTQFYKGTAMVKWPYSKHNSFPSRAIDVWPCPVPKDKTGQIDCLSPVWRGFAIEVLDIAEKLNIGVIWGGNDALRTDVEHWELK